MCQQTQWKVEGMSFRTVVASSGKSLSASEKRVIAVLLGEPEPSSLRAAPVAARAQTHESTVVRLAQKLGYSGFPDLRADLERDSLEPVAASALMRSDTGHELAVFARDEARALERLSSFIPQEQLVEVATAIHRSRVVYLFSKADERPALDMLARRLRRLGLVVVELGLGGKDLAERFISFTEGSVLIAFALREAPSQLPALVREAERRGGTSILISDAPGYHFRPAPTHLLVAQRGDDSEYNTLIIPIAIAYALQLAIFHLDPDRYGAVRDDINDVSRLVGGTDEIPLR